MMVNVKTLNGSEHDGRSFIFFIEIENFRGEGKILMRHNFFWKKSWFLQNFRRERTVFHFIFKENGKSEAVFQHFWSARRQFFFQFPFWKKWSGLSKELKLKLMWPKYTNILFIFSFLFFRCSNMITFLLQNW
jgi:hypothetical protein